jgi:hypothetical protein
MGWACLAVLVVPGCTRLNSAFGASGEADTDGPASSDDGESTASPTETTSATDIPPDDDDSASDSGATDESGEEDASGADRACVEESRDCVLFFDEDCPDGDQCRPYSNGGAHRVGCVPKPDAEPLEVGERCEHLCQGEIGLDRCPLGTICDPHAEEPRCIPLCDEACVFGECEPYDGYSLCRPECDLLEQDCPDPSEACFLSAVPYCDVPQGAPDGSPCMEQTDCSEGSACLPNGNIETCPTGFCCATLCELGARDCALLLECTPILGAVAGIGFCN